MVFFSCGGLGGMSLTTQTALVHALLAICLSICAHRAAMLDGRTPSAKN